MIRSRFQRFVRKAVWGMDVHRSARIAPSALIDRTFPRGIHIEADVLIDEEAVVLTHDRVRGLYLHTRIGAGTVIGPRAIVLPGVTVGRECFVGAGAVVVRDIADGVMVMGNPARPVAKEADMEIIQEA